MIKGYKASYSAKCLTLNYEVGKTYTFNGELEICQQGFHFCKELKNVFNYYQNKNDEKLVVFEIEALGEVVDGHDDKSVTDKIRIVRILDCKEYEEFIDIYEYDKNNNCIYHKSSSGHKRWFEYDKNNNLIHYKDIHGDECWRKYDEDNKLLYLKEESAHKICSEYSKEYDKNSNCIHSKNSNGFEQWCEYDKYNNRIHFKDSSGFEE